MSTEQTQVAATDTTNAAPVVEQKQQANETATQVADEQKQAVVSQENAVPEKYELKLDDNSPLDSEYLEAFSQFAKEKKLSQEQAQEFLAREQNAALSYAQKQAKEFESMQKAWVSEIKNDSEIGGEGFAKNVEVAKRALEKFGTQKFMQELEQTGYGNHPELVRIFARIGKQMSNDTMVSQNSNSGGAKSFEDIFYGKQN